MKHTATFAQDGSIYPPIRALRDDISVKAKGFSQPMNAMDTQT